MVPAQAQTGLRVSTSELEIREGSSDTFSVWLSSQPSHPVTVTLSSDNQDVTASFDLTAKLIFNSGNWNVGRTIYVLTQKDDDAAEDTAKITFRASSTDTDYNNASETVTVTVRDKDTAGLRISRNAININEGGADSFTVALTVKPTGGTVTVNVESSDEYVAGVSPGSLTFNSGNWNRARTVTVTGLHDNDKDDDTEDLSLSSDHTGGSREYQGVSGNVRVTVGDDDSYLHIPVVSISGASPVTEGEVIVFTVRRTLSVKDPLEVLLRVSENQDFVAASDEGNNKSVTIPRGSSSVTYTVPTTDDNPNEPDGTVTAELRGSIRPLGEPHYFFDDNADSATVMVKDNKGMQPSQNTAPTVANPIPDRTARVGTLFNYQFPATTFNDVDGDSMTYTATLSNGSDLPSWLNFNENTRRFSGTPASGDTGAITVRVTASDGNLSVSDDFDIMVVGTLPPNTPEVSISGGGPAGGGGGGGSGGGDDDSDTSPDREALLAIYEASGGDNWDTNRNWGRSDEPVSRWYGVTTDDNNRVVALYLDDNDLTGEIPVSSLQSLSELEELALWGNPELGETVPVGFEKQVERAVLRTINDDNGPQGGISGWFPEDGSDVSDYSGWEGVTVDTNGRVSELDLSNEGLSKDITEALSELLVLETLDLSDNSDLEGELPTGLMDTQLMELDISGTGICVPGNEEFIMWLEEIDFTDTDSCVESEPMEPVDSEPAESSGGGGCAIVSDTHGGSGYQVALFALGIVALCVSRRRQSS